MVKQCLRKKERNKEMKNKLTLVAIICGLAIVDACSPDNLNEKIGIPDGAIPLNVEGYQSHDTKTSVNNKSVQWVNGDKVKLNDAEYTVTVNDGGQAYVMASLSGQVYGYSPIDLVASWNTPNLTIKFPSEYKSYYFNVDGKTRQKIDLPIASYTTSVGNGIQFKHLSSAVRVLTTNEMSLDVVLDSVIVSSSSYKLNGTKQVVLNADGVPTVDIETTTEENSVCVILTDTPILHANAVDTLEVQVPIRPIGNSGDLTISVYTHEIGTVGHQYIFNHTASLPNVLNRNMMLTAGCRIHTGEGNHVNEIKHGFSVSSTKQVLFSQGNLQYIGSAGGYWKFADNQWSYLGDNGQNQSSQTDNNIDRDLFFRYDCPHGELVFPWYDWGKRPIVNGGDNYSQWYAPSFAEWHYLLHDRDEASNKWGLATVNGVSGLVILPDTWSLPQGCSFNSTDIGYTANLYDDKQWDRMEKSGAVFLPAAGYWYTMTGIDYVGSNGYYHGVKDLSDGNYKCQAFWESGLMGLTMSGDCCRLSVRMVKDAD